MSIILLYPLYIVCLILGNIMKNIIFLSCSPQGFDYLRKKSSRVIWVLISKLLFGLALSTLSQLAGAAAALPNHSQHSEAVMPSKSGKTSQLVTRAQSAPRSHTNQFVTFKGSSDKSSSDKVAKIATESVTIARHKLKTTETSSNARSTSDISAKNASDNSKAGNATASNASAAVPASAGATANSNAKANSTEEIPVLTTTTVLKKLIVPWEIRFLAKDSWLITERPGYLTILRGETVKRIKIPAVENIGEGGLLGLAIHPDYKTNHWIYLYRTTQKNGKPVNQVIRYKLENNHLSQEKTIIDDIPASSIHNGGRIAFGPDKYLYVTTGDSGQQALAQDKTSLAGKILRVDDEGKIPTSNPFNNAVFSYGHRDPQGLAWDDKDRLWATETASTGSDKLNIILSGKNYGWPNVKGKGNQAFKDLEKSALTSGWNTTWGSSGLAFWNSKLYFGGLKGESLYEVDLSSTPFKVNKYFENQFGRIRAVNVGADDALYLTTSNQDGQAKEKDPEDDLVIRIPRPRSRNETENAKIDAEYPVSHSFR